MEEGGDGGYSGGFGGLKEKYMNVHEENKHDTHVA